ncbi:MAG: glutamate--tRNA ligase family protein, partial [Candidatus Neomarinimicrobiota bacterium]
DHVSNTSKQMLIYKALKYKKPVFAHLPMILGPDKKRLSKRHGAPGIQIFRQEGYLPIAVLNYMALLGWNPGTEDEIFSLEELVNLFDLEQVQKKSAVWDEQKLYWISGQQIMKTPTNVMLDSIRATSPDWGKGKDISFLIGVIKLLKVRAKSLQEFRQQSTYFFEDPVTFDKKASRKRWKDATVNELVLKFKEKLQIIDWNAEEIENILRDLAEAEKISTGKLIHPVRLALTGVPHGPSLFALMELLGKNACLGRIDYALSIFPQKEEV